MRPSNTLFWGAAAVLLPHAMAQFKTLVYEGCYNTVGDMIKNSSYIYNSKGYCQTMCVPINMPIQATTNSTDCYCGDAVPPSSAKVSDSFCNDGCAGYGGEMCGAKDAAYFSVYLTGVVTTGTATNAEPDSNESSSVSSMVVSSQTTSATPSVVTIGGQTIVVTASSSPVPSASPSSSKPNTAAIAAGVIVGVVVIAAIAGGVFFYSRNRKNREVEEEYRRNAAVSNFIAGGKPTASVDGSSFTDTRLDPVMAQRRMSDGSIADNQDYSRRILKVTNA